MVAQLTSAQSGLASVQLRRMCYRVYRGHGRRADGALTALKRALPWDLRVQRGKVDAALPGS